MRNVAIQKIEEEINEKMKMTEKAKENLRREIFTNIIISACLVAYFIFLFLGGIGKTKEVSITNLKIFSTIYLVVAIILFEIAYRKDNEKIAIHGIEILVIAIITLFLPYIIFELDTKHQKIYAFMGAYIAVYYVIKCICIALKRKKNYSKEVSDIKEIVKKEKRQIKNEEEIVEEAPKKVIEKTKETPKKRGRPKKQETVEKEKKTTIKKEAPKEVIQKKEETPKKRGRPKKQETIEKEKKTTIKKEAPKKVIEKTKETPKKRGRPKKQETIEKEKSKAKVEETKTENTPKKRGRPRKVVTE